MFEFKPNEGTLSIAGAGFDKGIVYFSFDRCTFDSSQLSWKQRGSEFVAVSDGLELSIAIDKQGLKAAAKNTGSRAIRLMDVKMEFHPSRLADAPLAENYFEYIHSFNFETLSGVKRVGLPNRWLKANPPSSMVYVLHHRKSRRAWLFSTLPPHAGDLVTFRALHDSAHMEGRFGLEIKCVLECLIEPGKSIATSTIQFRGNKDAMALLTELGVQWQEGLKKPLKPPTVGWNTWDYFAEAFSSADILENARATRTLFGVERPDVVIDGGWDERWGRWEPSTQIPEGLEKFVGQLAQEGFVPGIWIAATGVNVYTRLYRDHGDWFVRDRSGKILEESYGHGQTVHLDITIPQVQSLIHETFTRLRGYGFRIFKVDFTQHVTLSGGFPHDGTVPRGAVLRKLFEVIRNAIGPDNYLFTCGAPFETVTGLADSVRTTGDIHNHWSHVLLNLTGISARWWMNRRLWNNDPDFLIVRTPNNSPNVPLNRPMGSKPLDYTQLWRSGREFNDREAQDLCVSCVARRGGNDVERSSPGSYRSGARSDSARA